MALGNCSLELYTIWAHAGVSETSTATLDDAPVCLGQLVVEDLTWGFFLLKNTFDLAIL